MHPKFQLARLVTLAVLLAPRIATADGQPTGRLVGRVVDAGTGQGLAGVG